LKGDADIVGVSAVGDVPDFDSMFAIEVKALRFSLDDVLKGLGSKLDESEEQADKLKRLGFPKTAILYFLTTENTPERDLGGSQGWWDATDRGLRAWDVFKPLVKDRPRRHHVFVWPWGAHPSKGEHSAGAGAPQFVGGPDLPSASSMTTSAANRAMIAENLTRMIQNIVMPRVRPLPSVAFLSVPIVFGHCPECPGITQYFRDGRRHCKRCGPAQDWGLPAARS